MTAISQFHNKGDKENLTEHNSACSEAQAKQIFDDNYEFRK